MNKYLKYLLFAIIIAIPGLIFNLKNSIYADEISVMNVITTIIYFVGWFIYGFNNGNKKEKSFVIFTMIYWSIECFLYLICYNCSLVILYPITLFNIIPMYSLNYLLKIELPYGVFVEILIIFSVVTIGYLSGNLFNSINYKEKT